MLKWFQVMILQDTHWPISREGRYKIMRRYSCANDRVWGEGQYSSILTSTWFEQITDTDHNVTFVAIASNLVWANLFQITDSRFFCFADWFILNIGESLLSLSLFPPEDSKLAQDSSHPCPSTTTVVVISITRHSTHILRAHTHIHSYFFECDQTCFRIRLTETYTWTCTRYCKLIRRVHIRRYTSCASHTLRLEWRRIISRFVSKC